VDKFDSKLLINALCEFKDRELEAEYFSNDMTDFKKYIRPVMLSLGILNTLFAIPDYLLIRNTNALIIIFAGRVAFLSLIFLLFLLVNRIENSKTLLIWISACEIFVFLLFLLVFCEYDKPDFLIQVLGVILIILVIFLIPNRWPYMVVISALGSTSFFLIAVIHMKSINAGVFFAGVVYTAIVFVLSCTTSYRSNYYKRFQYINNRELKRLSLTDILTGLNNRAKLYEELKMWMTFSNRYSTPLSLVLFDIDDFKQINDKLGHLTGDKVIVEVTDIISNIIRETDILARWGGDEFIILLPHTNRTQALELTERIRKGISRFEFSEAGAVTCSFGVASRYKHMEHDEHGENVEQFIRSADEALYKAKNSGKNVVMY